MKNFKYHFEAEKGWINDPNGLSLFNGKIHMFFQHNPYDIHWDKMHWGHAVTSDFLDFQELPIALYPDQEYENGGGCFSGSAIEHEGKLHIFYTAVDKNGIQSLCHAIMDKENNILKDEKNPLFTAPKDLDPKEFRDPKITFMDGHLYMVIGGSHNGLSCVVLYETLNMEDFTYLGILYENKEYGYIMECPDFFKLGEEYVLTVSLIGKNPGTRVLTGTFENHEFKMKKEYEIEMGSHYYAAQSFLYEDRRIQIGWLRDIYCKDSLSAGCMGIPRELTFTSGKIHSFPVKEAWHLLKNEDENVLVNGNKLYYHDECIYEGEIKSLDMLRDGKLLEIFLNKGEKNFIFFDEK